MALGAGGAGAGAGCLLRPAAAAHPPASFHRRAIAATPPSSPRVLAALLHSAAQRGRHRRFFPVRSRLEPVLFPGKKERGGGGAVRARADGTAKPETEAAGAAEENGRTGWSGEQDSQKAKALGDSTIYPIMRIYRNDLCTLEVTGDAKAMHAIEAMAADGGFTAAEELSKGRSLMTVETIVPGRWEDRSTVSTKLLAPTHLVHKTAKTVWANKKVGTSSGNALARAFQKVVMQHLLSFDIHLRSPGSVRDMSDLANENEGAVVARLESRDAEVLDDLAGAVCSHSLANIEDFHQRQSGNSSHNRKFSFRREPEWIWVSDKAIGVRSVSDAEVAESAEKILSTKSEILEPKRTHPSWWPPSTSLPSDVLPGDGFNCWNTEFVPIHKLQIDTSKMKVMTKGWQATKTRQILELNLTHAQMVDLADMLNLYYEDAYTAPLKNLRSGAVLKMSPVSQSKVSKALWAALLSCVAGAILFIGLLVVARLKVSPSRSLSSTYFVASSSPTSDTSFTNRWCRVRTDRQPRLPSNADIPAGEMEALCLLVINRVKDGFSLAGQVESNPDRGAWIGSDLTRIGESKISASTIRDRPGGAGGSDQIQEGDGAQHRTEDSQLDVVPSTLGRGPLLIYQVVISRSGRVVGFQPCNKLAIGQWASFPFAKELHKRRRLTAGLFETGVKYFELTEDVISIELLCQTQSTPPAFTARPLSL